MAEELKLNKPLIEKMIARMTEKPEAYDQTMIVGTVADLHRAIEKGGTLPRPDPQCGAAGCLIAQAIICDAPTVEQGIAKLKRLERSGNETNHAADLMGLSYDDAWTLFYDWQSEWPEPYRPQFAKAKTYKGQASAAVALLRAILRTDGKILEGTN